MKFLDKLILEEMKISLKKKSKTPCHVKYYESWRTRNKKLKRWVRLSEVFKLLDEYFGEFKNEV